MARTFSKLSRPTVRALAPGERITEHGITFERLADGDGRYSVNVMVDGQRIHRIIGKDSEGVTRTACEQFVEKVRSEAREGRLSLPAGRKIQLPFADAAQKYLDRLKEADGKNLGAKERHFRRYLIPFFGSQRLDTISTFTVDRYKRQRRNADASNGTINLELATLSHLINRAVEWGWLRSSPCKIHLLEKAPGQIIALTDAQAGALVRAAVADDDPACWLFVAFGLNTAMRHREILRARFEELDLENRRLFVPKAKGGQREQPFTPQLAQILQREMEMRAVRVGWIFPSPRPNTSTSGHRDRMSKSFRAAVVRAGLDPETVTPHVMRHTAITKLVQAGVDLPTIQRISGHKTLAMVLRYTHVHGRHIDTAIAMLGRSAPELTANKSRGPATQALHKAPSAIIAISPRHTKK